MGFFESDIGTGSRSNRRVPVEMLRRNGCVLCPLNKAELNTPKMEPDGSDEPGVLCLGEAPGEDEDRRGRPFVGRSGRLLRSYIPKKWEKHVRFSNVTQCWPGKGNPDPTEVSIECCRPRVVSDIEKTKPIAIFGFGNFALSWVTGQAGITAWRGRRLPVRVGDHTCWFYPMLHPSYILHKQEERGWGDDEQLFAWDMARAFAEISKLPEPVVHTAEEAKRNVKVLAGHEPGALGKVKDWLQYAAKASHAGVDYETNGKRPYGANAKILSAGVSVADEALAFAFDHREVGWKPQERAELGVLWTEFLCSDVVKVAHFAGFEMEWSGVMFGRETVRASTWEDTASQAWVLDERTSKMQDGPMSLGWLTLQNFGLNIKKLSRVDRKNLDDEPLDAVLPYNAIDARYHDWLYVAQAKRLVEAGLWHQYELMAERVPTVVLTQMRGIPVDPAETMKLEAEYSARLAEIDAEIAELPEIKSFEKKRGEPFNPGSNPQLKELLRTELNVFADTVDEEFLKTLDHPIAELEIQHRKYTKRKSTYVDSYTSSGFLWPDGLLHPNFNTVFVRTGRSSSDEPNVQNVIKHDAEGKYVRKQVKARPGHVLVSVDQGQIQARNVAMESRDKVFCKMLWEDYDIHMDWAERLARRYPDAIGGKKNLTDKDVMKAFRQKTKNKFVFARFFNAQLPTLSSGMEIPEEYLRPEFKEWERIFSGITEWHEKLYRDYKENGFIRNVEGFYFRAPLSPNQIVNTPIQCDEALVVFGGFNRLSARGDELLQPINEIHDDLLFEFPVEEVERLTRIAVDDMLRCDFDWINVPLSVEVSIGESWLEMHEEAKFRSDHWHGTPVRAKEFT